MSKQDEHWRVRLSGFRRRVQRWQLLRIGKKTYLVMIDRLPWRSLNGSLPRPVPGDILRVVGREESIAVGAGMVEIVVPVTCPLEKLAMAKAIERETKKARERGALI